MKTVMLLMTQYDAQSVISVATLCRDYFPHLTPEVFLRKVGLGEIRIPVVHMDSSQKSTKGVHLQDLADYIDARRSEAVEKATRLYR